MPTVPEAHLLVLHGLRLKGTSEQEGLAELTGLSLDDVAEALDALAADGLVRHSTGLLSGWTPTAKGRATQEHWLGDQLDAADGRPAVDSVYRQFRPLNLRLLTAVTDWQLRDGALNHHDDRTWDAAVVDRLAAIDGAVQAPLTDLEATLERFAWHRPRLAAALAHVQKGEGDWVDRPGIDSYHTVWFQLHEDLLNTLGRQRSDEAAC